MGEKRGDVVGKQGIGRVVNRFRIFRRLGRLWLHLAAVAGGMLAGCGESLEERAESCEPDVPESRAASTREGGSRSSEMVRLAPKSLDRQDWSVGMEKGDRVGDGTEVAVVEETPPSIAPGAEWDTEAVSAEAVEVLKVLMTPPSRVAVAERVASDFEGTALWPEDLPVVFEESDLVVRRMPSMAGERIRPLEGVEGLRSAVEALRARFRDGPRVEWKPVGVAMNPSPGVRVETRVLVEIAGTLAGKEALGEVHAEWRCRWAEGESLQLLQLTVESMQLTTSGGTQPWFEDVTGSVMAEVHGGRDQILTGIESWAQRVTRYGDLFLTGHHGLAIGDVNGDGREDVYVCDGGSLPNRLYVQQADGTVRDRSREAGVDFLEDSRGALLIDLDNDGDQDLAVATIAMIVVAENDGSGVFTLRGGHGGARYPSSLSAADPDNDGDLDLYVCVYEGERASGSRGFEARMPVPFHDASNGGRNVLLENLGDFEFTDATARMGLAAENDRWSLAAAWEDFDRDGDPDLYVANDFGRNQFFRNEHGRFVNIAPSAGVEDMAAGMSVAWGDVNRDGQADLYVGNMFSSAGRRIAYQRQFGGGGNTATEGKRRMARGNSLFVAVNETPDVFADVSESAGVTMGRWAWSSAMADLDNDGWEDLLVANGFLTNRREDDL